MNYQTIILKILSGRQYVVCHINLLLQEFAEKSEPRLGLENWCFHHGIEMTYINSTLVKLSKKSSGAMEFNAYLS